jgi:hypothetical protein
MRKLIFLMIGMALTVLVTANEFWLQPDRFLYAAGQTISLRFWIGENFEGENWKGNRAAVEKIQLRQNDVSDELTEDLGSEPGDSLELALHEEGTAMISFRSKNKFIQLDAAKSLRSAVERQSAFCCSVQGRAAKGPVDENLASNQSADPKSRKQNR